MEIFFFHHPHRGEKKYLKGLPFSKQPAYVSRVTHDHTMARHLVWPLGPKRLAWSPRARFSLHLKPAAKSVATCTAAALSRSDRSLSYRPARAPCAAECRMANAADLSERRVRVVPRAHGGERGRLGVVEG